MYKKIHFFLATSILLGLINTMLGMEKEIPVLAVNNYIINVSSAYQGLQKENSLIYDMLNRTRFQKINDSINAAQNFLAHFHFRIGSTFLETTRDTRFPTFMRIKIAYEPSPINPNIPDARVSVVHYMYTFCNFVKYRPYPWANMTQHIKNIPSINPDTEKNSWAWLVSILHKKIKCQDDIYFVELCSDKHISDWITIIKNNQNI